MVAYTIRDIDRAIETHITKKKFKLPMDGKNVPVPVIVGTPDEFIAQRSYPCIYVEPGYDTYVDPQWQTADTAVLDAHPTDPTRAVRKTSRVVDILYSLKISTYVTLNDHRATANLWLAKLFPLDSCVEGVTELTKEDFCFPLRWDGQVLNMDDQNSLVKMALGLSASQLASDVRIYRRDIVVTAHLQTEDISVDTPQINFAGLRLLWNNE